MRSMVSFCREVGALAHGTISAQKYIFFGVPDGKYSRAQINMFPVRCFTCSRVIGNQYGRYTAELDKGHTPMEALATLGIGEKRFCCRRHFLCHVPICDLMTGFASEGCAAPVAEATAGSDVMVE
jgi:DNA-directed RNA polymerase subunit N